MKTARSGPTCTAHHRLRLAAFFALALVAVLAAATDLPLPNADFQTRSAESALPAEWRPRAHVDQGGEHALVQNGRDNTPGAQIRFERKETGYFYSAVTEIPLSSRVSGSAWVNVEAAGSGAYLLLYFRSDDDAFTGHRVSSEYVTTTNGRWQRLTVTATPPPTAHAVTLALQFEGPGEARFDDAELSYDPLPLLEGVDLATASQTLTGLPGGRCVTLSDPVSAGQETALDVSFSSLTGLPPSPSLALVFFGDGQQLGYQVQREVAPLGYDYRTKLVLRSRPGVDRIRAAVLFDSSADASLVDVAMSASIKPDLDAVPVSSLLVPDHPRLFATEATLEHCRERLLNAPADTALGGLRRTVWEHAEAALKRQEIKVYGGRYGTTLPPAYPPKHPDNFPYWTGLSREIERGMQTMATRYAITGERRFAEKAVEWSLALADWPVWSDPSYGQDNACLDTSHFCHGVAMVYDLCFDVMTEAQRQTLRNALLEKGAAAAMKDGEEGWARTWNWPNGFAVVMGGMGIAGAVTLGEDPRAQEFVRYARRRLYDFLTSRGQDGGYIEGLLYGGYAMSHITPFAEAMRVLGDDSLATHPYLAKTLAFAASCTHAANGTCVNLCDSSRRASTYWTSALLRSSYGDPVAGWFLDVTRFGTAIDSWGMTYALTAAQRDFRTSPPALAESSVYRDIGWTVHRTGFQPEDWLIAVRSGPAGSHCQQDQNSWQLCAGGEWLLTDAGYGKRDTGVHTTLLVNGNGQSGGDGRVSAFASLPGFRYSRHEAGDCYSALTRFTRHLALINSDMLLVVDETSASGGSAKIESRLQLAGDAEVTLSAEAAAVHIQGDSHALKLVLPDAFRQALSVAHERNGKADYAAVTWSTEDTKAVPLIVTAGDTSRRLRMQENTDGSILLRIEGDSEANVVLLAPDRRVRELGSGVTTDARVAWLRTAAGGRVLGGAIIRGTRVSRNNTELIRLARVGDCAIDDISR